MMVQKPEQRQVASDREEEYEVPTEEILYRDGPSAKGGANHLFQDRD